MKKILRSLMLVGFLVCSACSWSSGDGHDDVDNQNNNQTETENNENEKKSDESEKKSDETPQKEIEYGYLNVKYVSFMSKSTAAYKVSGLFMADSARIIICKADETSSILIDDTKIINIRNEGSNKGVFDARYKLPVGKYIAKIDIFNNNVSVEKALLHGESSIFEILKGENSLPNVLCKPCETENFIFDEVVTELRVKPNTERWFSYTAQKAGKLKFYFCSPNPADLNFYYVIYDEDGNLIRKAAALSLARGKTTIRLVAVPAKKIYLGICNPYERNSCMYNVRVSFLNNDVK